MSLGTTMLNYADPTANTSSSPWFSNWNLGLQGGQGWWGSDVTRKVPANLQPTQDSLIQLISNMMLGGNNPTLRNMQTSAVDSINRSYAQMPSTVTSRLSGLGFGS